MRPLSDIDIESDKNKASRSGHCKTTQKEPRGSSKINVEDNIDLSKMSISDCHSLLKRIKNGTPLLVALSIVGGTFAIGAEIFSLGFYAHEFHPGSKQNEQSSPEKNVSEIEAASRLREEWTEKLQVKDSQINELNEKIVALQANVSKKPSYSTCSGYETEVKKLYQNKQNTETIIQRLLAPEVPKEYAQQGIYYSIVQLETFAKQASEYRKMADDIQRQILAVQALRDRCE